MRNVARIAAGLIGAAGLLLATGCGPGPKDAQIQSLQEQVNDLQKQKDDLRDRLNSLMGEVDNANQRALDLQRLLDQARRQLAERPENNLPEGWQGGAGIAWTDIEDDILFDSGKADLKSTGRKKLDEVVKQIKQFFPEYEIWVVGHTDNEPIRKTKNLWKDNLDLSANRAMMVVRTLWEMGIDKNRVIAAGAGEYRPKVPNSTPQNRAQNRRVQILAVQRPGTEAPLPNRGGDAAGANE